MPRRPLSLLVAVAAGLLPVALTAAPASAHTPSRPAAAPHRVSSSHAPAAASQLPARVSVSSNARTAYSGRYAKFLSTFRCDPGRLYQLDGVLEQRRGSSRAVATSEDEGPTGVCTGRTQQRLVYLVIGGLDRHGNLLPLATGRGRATVLLSTATSPSSRPRLDAAALATVRVYPR